MRRRRRNTWRRRWWRSTRHPRRRRRNSTGTNRVLASFPNPFPELFGFQSSYPTLFCRNSKQWTYYNLFCEMGKYPMKRIVMIWKNDKICLVPYQLRIQNVYPGSRIWIFSIPDPHQRIKVKLFLTSRKYDPDGSSRIRIPEMDPDFFPIQDPGVKRHPIPGQTGTGSWIRIRKAVPECFYQPL